MSDWLTDWWRSLVATNDLRLGSLAVYIESLLATSLTACATAYQQLQQLVTLSPHTAHWAIALHAFTSAVKHWCVCLWLINHTSVVTPCGYCNNVSEHSPASVSFAPCFNTLSMSVDDVICTVSWPLYGRLSKLSFTQDINSMLRRLTWHGTYCTAVRFDWNLIKLTTLAVHTVLQFMCQETSNKTDIATQIIMGY